MLDGKGKTRSLEATSGSKVYTGMTSDTGTIKETVERTDTEFGFTWANRGNDYFIRNPDGQFKRVSKSIVETLKRKAEDTTIKELVADVSSERPGAAATIREFRDRKFVRRNASITRIDPPTDIALWPRSLAVGVLMVLSAALSYETLTAVGTSPLGNPRKFGIGTIALVALATVVGMVIHEYGHLRTARSQGLTPSIGLSIKNGIVPTVVTRTHGGWALPRNRRRWITLAGPGFGLAFTVGLFVVSRLLPAQEWLGLAAIACFATQVAPLSPLFHGDGYLLLTDTLNSPNLRTRGKRALRQRRLNAAAAYVLLSYGLYVGLFVAQLVVGFLIGDLLGVAAAVGTVGVVYLFSGTALASRLRDALAFVVG